MIALPPAPFEVVLEADGTLRIDGNDGRVFDVDEVSTAYAGSYGVEQSALASGPAALVPPALSAPINAAPGDVVAITPALFAYDPDLGDPVIGYSAGVDASDPDGPFYIIQPGDQGTTLSIAATASQGAFNTVSNSDGIAVP